MNIETHYRTNSAKYQVGAVFTNSSGLSVTVVGRVTLAGKKYPTHFIVKFEDGTEGCFSRTSLDNGSFKYPINLSSLGNKHRTVYKRFEQIRERCTNEYNKDYIKYGGRGIKCEFNNVYEFLFELKKDERFEYLLESPSLYQIDRIDNNGNYCKGNIRIATPSENSRNRRNNHVYDLVDKNTGLTVFSGIKKDCEDWVEENLGVKTSVSPSKGRIGLKNGFTIICKARKEVE